MVVVLALAALIRYYDLAQRGLIYWDEAKFSLEGIRFHAYLQSLVGSGAALHAGKTIGTGKPTHALLIALGYGIFGIHTYVPLYVDAFSSVIAVALVWFVGRRLFGPWAGVIAALFLAVSEYDAIYARSALSESDADLLFLGAVVFWVLDWERMRVMLPNRKGFPSTFLVLCALLAGVSFTTNYRLIVYIAALFIFDLAWTVNEYGWRPTRGRLVSWVAGLLAAPALWQVIDVVARLNHQVLFRSEVNIIVKNGRHVLFRSVREGGAEYYLQQALFQLHAGKGKGFRFDPLLYLQWFVLREGWVIALLVLVALFFAVRSRLFPWLAMAALVVIPFIVYNFAPFIVPRNLDGTLPFVALLAAAALVSLAERVRGDVARRAALVVLALAVAAAGARQSWSLTGVRSGYAQASSYLRTQGNGKAIASNEIMVFYLSGTRRTGCEALPPASSLPKLAAERNAGYRYAVLDHRAGGITGYIIDRARLVRRFLTSGPISVGENLVASENGDPLNSTHLDHVSVYDMSRMPLPPAGKSRPAVCSKDVPL